MTDYCSPQIQFHLYKSQQQTLYDLYHHSWVVVCRWEARSIFVSIKAVKHPCLCLCAGRRERTEGSTEVLWRAALTASDAFWPPRWSHLLKRIDRGRVLIHKLFSDVRVRVKRACHVFTVQMLPLSLHNIALIPGSAKASDPVLGPPLHTRRAFSTTSIPNTTRFPAF